MASSHLEPLLATLRRPRYPTSASCTGAEPTSTVHIDCGSADMLASRCDLEYVGGVGAELCHRQPTADVKVSGQVCRAIGCGCRTLTAWICVSHRSGVVVLNIFILSFNLPGNVKGTIVRLS